MISDGFQVPAIGVKLFEFAGKLGFAAPKHNGPIVVNVGVTGASIVMLKVVVVAHWPAVGVNVYTVVPVVAVLTAGAQVPVIGVTLVELVGNTGAVAFWQTFATALNVGVTGESTVILNVVVVAHCPAVGVNV